MSLYERNSIHYSEHDNQEIVYVSYPCEDDGQYDYLLLKNIDKVSLKPIYVETINIACSVVYRTVSFVCTFNKEVDDTHVEVSAMIDDFKGEAAKIELQIFVDELATSIYENNPFEQSEYLEEAKRCAIEHLKRDYFNATGNIVSNFTYNTVGRVIDANGNVMSIINNFNTCVENKEMIFTLNNCVSYVPLKDINVSKIEFITGKAKFVINDFKILSSSEGMLRQYQIIANNSYVEETNENIIAETITEIYDDDFYFDSVVHLLSDKDKLFENSNTFNSVNDLFDDFDF